MPRIQYDKAELIADWKTGKFTERALAQKHRISPATAHKLVAGIDKDIPALVSKQIEINQQLAEMTEQEVSKFEREVSERTKHIQFFTTAAVQNVKEAMSLQCEDQADFQKRADTILKAKEAVLGKTPETAIQINNNQTVDPSSARATLTSRLIPGAS